MQTSDRIRIKRNVRTIWISDVHLGFPGCSADYLLAFIRDMRCERLYLVGDIIDFWALKKKRYWPQAHNNVVRSILGKAKHDTRVIYVPGNHDEAMREYAGLTLGNVEIHDRIIHETADGRRLLVMHGDQFDSAVVNSKFIGLIGSSAYELLLRMNRYVNWWRERMGLDYWSLAAATKHKVKKAVKYISNFEQAVAHEAHRQQVDGLICGHIHRAELTRLDGVTYMNCGDWVESCTALVEHHDGTIELLKLTDEAQVLKRMEPIRPELAA
ncbi:MAG: UDP-2,3-diacylglucosamine diphosphatase [Wenzhouxiangellaceae bacterium]|nr:UDP-2,3-diacylglucosamine diphosphatase [Wenzhouxiangellaceae bacterium]MBS3745453.1 UDP-2,3-diacylglucosamine diphosphatase [Wenzhouxiangellaceae bacterium]MBS3822771.1 UDP-2,3-diacylglucosamine diphosphatase [Wenzhouxiangellaceae bacterium]